MKAQRKKRCAPILDSGATENMFCEISEAAPGSYRKGSEDAIQLAAGQDPVPCEGTGTLSLDGLQLQNCVHASDLNGTLISVGKICDQNRAILFTASGAVVLKCKKIDINPSLIESEAVRDDDGLYSFSEKSMMHTATKAKVSTDINVWHNRLNHVNVRVLKGLHKHADFFPELNGSLPPCEPCLLGKATRKPFDSKFEQTKYAGEVIHSDVVGPLPVAIDGSRYIVTFQDQFSRITHAMGISEKAGTTDAFERYKVDKLVQIFFKHGVTRLHSDGGGEYETVSVADASTTTPDTPQHNPFAERVNRTILDPIRVLLEQSGLSGRYWQHALRHVMYVRNRLPHSALGCSPIERLTGDKPKLHHVRTFGCSAFVFNNHPESKVHARATPGILLGCDDHGVYTVMRRPDRKIVRSVHVTFREDEFPGLEQKSESSSGEEAQGFEEPSSSSDASASSGDEGGVFTDLIDSSDEEITHAEALQRRKQKKRTHNQQEKGVEPLSNTRPSRKRSKPDRLTYKADKAGKVHRARKVISFPITTSDEPTVEEAMNASPPEKAMWLEAIIQELESLERKKTWIPLGEAIRKGRRFIGPDGERLLPTHMVLKIKRNKHGQATRFKARVVAGGHLQIEGLDFDGVYAPVVSFENVLLVQALCVQLGWHSEHLDYTNSFLNGLIDRDVSVTYPENLPACLAKNICYKLIKALYGLRQAPLCWFKTFRECLVKKLKFKQLKTDGSIFVKDGTSGTLQDKTVVLVYVDDIVVNSGNEQLAKQTKKALLKCFEGSDEGELAWYLGVRIERFGTEQSFSQKACVDQLVKKFQLEDVRQFDTPMIGIFHDELRAHADDDVKYGNSYSSLVGSLMYLANRTRPDIAFATSVLSQHMARPTAFLMRAAHRVVGYLVKTSQYGLKHCKRSTDICLEFFVDADYGGDQCTRKSRTGWQGFLNGNLFTWSSLKQQTTALSTGESEYVALSECCKEVKRVRMILAEIGVDMTKPTDVFCDSSVARGWAEMSQSMRKAKHIEIRFHFSQECVEAGWVDPLPVKSEENRADMFTKPLLVQKFAKFRHDIGVTDLHLPDTESQGEC